MNNAIVGCALLGFSSGLAPSARAGTAINVTRNNQVYTDLAQAAESARDGDRLELSGTFNTSRVYVFQDVTFVSVGAAALNGYFETDDMADVTIEGVTIENTQGSAIIAHGALTVRDLGLRGQASGAGGGILFDGTALTLERVTMTTAIANGNGGGISATSQTPYGAVVSLTDVTFAGTVTGGDGGGIYALNAVVDCVRCAFVGVNDTAVHAEGASALTFVESTFDGGRASTAGAIAAEGLTNIDVSRSRFCGVGGGSVIFGNGGGTVRNSVFADNDVVAQLDFVNGAFEIENNDFIGAPWALSSGGVGAFVADAEVRNNLFLGQDAGVLELWGTGIADPVEYNRFEVLPNAAIDAGNLIAVDPLVRGWSDDGDCTNDDLVPQPTSPLIDAGALAGADPDGSRVDIGAFGGAGADPSVHADGDGDGLSYIADCDDAAASVGAPTTLYADADGDGAGDVATAALACPGPGLVDDASDCDDGDASVQDVSTFARDADGDGYGDPADTEIACHPSFGFVVDASDCDDANPAAHALTLAHADSDGDGFGDPIATADVCGDTPGFTADATDCDDARPDVFPGAYEVCDGVDSNCADGVADEPTLPFHLDRDGDGYGDPAAVVQACGPSAGVVEDGTDCDDGLFTVRPGATETCDGVDEDCDGTVDDVGPASSWYPDRDADGYGDASSAIFDVCPPETGWVQAAGDCDDTVDAVHPGASEVCNGADDDCNGTTDDVGASEAWYPDGDGDGHGDPANGLTGACPPADGAWVTAGDDCDDADPEVWDCGAGGVDTDGDGIVSPGEGQDPGDGDEVSAEDDGCGCATGRAPAAPWLLAAGLGLVLRRRRG